MRSAKGHGGSPTGTNSWPQGRCSLSDERVRVASSAQRMFNQPSMLQTDVARSQRPCATQKRSSH
eukprot:12740084-Prorocentrum_lima.AAC.1